jgi:hypothetical protein
LLTGFIYFFSDEGELLDKVVERVVKKVKKRLLDEAAKDSENTALLEQQSGKPEVPWQWIPWLLGVCISCKIFLVIGFTIFVFIMFVTFFITISEMVNNQMKLH